MTQVVDYSWGRVGGNDASHAQAIADAGYVGAIRYLADRIDAKHVSRGELAQLWGRGLAVGLVWENGAADALGGYQAGRAHAERACRKADDLSFPRHRPIYYAVDTDTTWTYVAAYFDGVCDYHEAIGRPVGIYGSYSIIESARNDEARITFHWQCAAWSGNGTGTGGSIQGRRVSIHAELFQRFGYVLSDTCDANDVLGTAINLFADWGGYNPSHEYPTPTPGDTEVDIAELRQELVNQDTRMRFYMDAKFADVMEQLDPRANPNDPVIPIRDLVEENNRMLHAFDADDDADDADDDDDADGS